MSNAQLEKLKQEEAELEAQMLGNQTDPQQTEEPEVSATEDGSYERTEEELAADEFMMDTITGDQEEPEDPESFEPEQSEPEPHVPEEPEPQPQKPKRTNWKKRFVGLQKSHEASTHAHKREVMELRDQLAAQRREILELQSQMAQREVQGDLFEGAFTEEEEDTFGADGLDVVKKAAKVAIERQVKPIQEELQKHKQARVEDLERQAAEDKRREYQGFLSRLETLVPEYAELNVDKGFLQWLSEADDFSGYPRNQLFRRAEASRDVTRVADFFLEYQSTRAPSEQEIPAEAKRHVTPVGRGGGGAAPTKRKPSDKGYYRKSDIDKFFSDVMKGRYSDQQSVIEATEKAIEEAYLEGRVLHNQ